MRPVFAKPGGAPARRGRSMAPAKLRRGASFAVAGGLRDDLVSKICFALIGVGYLFPFSAMTQPVDYWHFLFPNFNVLFHLTACYNYVNLAVLALLVFTTAPQNSGRSFTFRITLGFAGQFIVLLIVPTSYFLLRSEYWTYVTIMGCMAAMAVVTAFLDSSAIALGSLYPTAMQESLQLGIGVSTLIGSVFRVCTKASGCDPTQRT